MRSSGVSDKDLTMPTLQRSCDNRKREFAKAKHADALYLPGAQQYWHAVNDIGCKKPILGYGRKLSELG